MHICHVLAVMHQVSVMLVELCMCAFTAGNSSRHGRKNTSFRGVQLRRQACDGNTSGASFTRSVLSNCKCKARAAVEHCQILFFMEDHVPSAAGTSLQSFHTCAQQTRSMASLSIWKRLSCSWWTLPQLQSQNPAPRTVMTQQLLPGNVKQKLQWP